ncbi:MAG: response regulator [Thermoplasmatota archaeon]
MPDALRVLLVDDDADTLESMAKTLRVLGHFDVLTAFSGAQGLKLLAAHPNVVVTDYKMPDMDGLEFTRRARDATDAPIVMVTAFQGPDLADEARRVGICRIVQKPIDFDQLVACIKEVARA